MVHRPLACGASWVEQVLCRDLETEAKPAPAEGRGTRRAQGDGAAGRGPGAAAGGGGARPARGGPVGSGQPRLSHLAEKRTLTYWLCGRGHPLFRRELAASPCPALGKRKISGGTRSAAGKRARDTFLGLLKTCAKLGVSFWDYLGARLKIPDAAAVPWLPDLIRQRAPT